MKTISKYLTILLCFLPIVMILLNIYDVNNISFIWWISILFIGYSGLLLFFINLIKNKFKFEKKYIFIILFFIVYIITSLLSTDLKTSIIGNSYRHNGLLTFISYIGLFFNIQNLDKEDFKLILKILTFNCFILCLMCLIDNIFNLNLNFNEYIYSSVFYNPNHFAYFIIIPLCLCLNNILIYKTNIINYIANYFIYIVILTTLILNNTFGTYIAFIIILIISCIYSIVKKKNVINIILVILIALLLSLFIKNKNGEIIVINNINSLVKDVNKLSIDKITYDSYDEELYHVGNRYILWKDGIKLALKSPIIGYGPDNLLNYYIKYNVVEDLPHNEFLQLQLTNGIICLFLYVGSIIYIIIKKSNRNIAILSFTLIAYLISSFFGNSMFYTTPYLYLILAMVYKLK